MIATYPCKKVELIIEKTALPTLKQILKTLDVSGHTVVPVQSGRGHQGLRKGSKVVPVLESIMVIIVLPADKAESLLEQCKLLLEHQIGIVCTSDVDVLRREQF